MGVRLLTALVFLAGLLAGMYLTAVAREGHADTVAELIDQYADFNGVPRWRAHRIGWCESQYLNIANRRGSGAKGIFQFIDSTWRSASAKAGWGGYSVWDVEANVAVALWLMGQGQWGHWRACW